MSGEGAPTKRGAWYVGLRCLVCGRRVLVREGFFARPAQGPPWARHLDCHEERK